MAVSHLEERIFASTLLGLKDFGEDILGKDILGKEKHYWCNFLVPGQLCWGTSSTYIIQVEGKNGKISF